MSWDVLFQDLPPGVSSIEEIPDDFEPGPLCSHGELVAKVRFAAPNFERVSRSTQPRRLSDDDWRMLKDDDDITEPPESIDRIATLVIECAIEVHEHLGPGFLESVYEQAMCIELGLRGIPFKRQVPVDIDYKGLRVGLDKIDLIVDGGLIVELKAVESFAPIHIARAISYLKASGLVLALVINFNVTSLLKGVKRVVRTPRNRRSFEH